MALDVTIAKMSEPQDACNVAVALTTRAQEALMADPVVNLEGEIWKPVVGCDRYSVSNLGRVRGPRRMLRLCINTQGYVYIGLFVKPGCPKVGRVHRLVLEAFVGPCPEGMECRHLNGDRADNRLVNLAWGTQADNMADRDRHGTTLDGCRHANAKLTAADVRAIRARAAKGEAAHAIAKDYRGVCSRTAIYSVVGGVTYKREGNHHE